MTDRSSAHRSGKLATDITLLGVFLASGCSGGSPQGGGNATGGSGAGGSIAGALVYKPCPATERVGGIAVNLIAAKLTAPAQTQIAGRVLNKVKSNEILQEVSRSGDCRLLVGQTLSCLNPTCAFPKQCVGTNQCADPPASQDAGTATITGLAIPVSMTFTSSQYYVALPTTTAYPPYDMGGGVDLRLSGAAVPALSLSVRGIVPLDVPTTFPEIEPDKPFHVTWTAPAPAGAGRILLILDIAHHGGISAQIECDLADTGSVSIPASLMTALIDRGTAGFPSMSLTRRSLDSISMTDGCVDFAVASSVERFVNVEGVVSCDDQSLPCPAGKTCGADLKCN